MKGTIVRIRKHQTYYTGDLRDDYNEQVMPFVTTDSFRIYDKVEFDLEDRSKKACTLCLHVNAVNLRLLNHQCWGKG